MRLWMLVAVASLAVAPANAQDADADGSKDHPMFSRMPGYYIQEYDAQDFSTFELDIDPPKTVEGRYTKISYWMKDGAKKAGPVQIAVRLTTAGLATPSRCPTIRRNRDVGRIAAS